MAMKTTKFKGRDITFDPSLFFPMNFKGTTIFDLTVDGYVDLAHQCGLTRLDTKVEHFGGYSLNNNKTEKKSEISTNMDNRQDTTHENKLNETTGYVFVCAVSASVTINGITASRVVELTSQTVRRSNTGKPKPVNADQIVQLAETTALKQAIKRALNIKKGDIDKIAKSIGIKPDNTSKIVTIEDEADTVEPEELSRNADEIAKGLAPLHPESMNLTASKKIRELPAEGLRGLTKQLLQIMLARGIVDNEFDHLKIKRKPFNRLILTCDILFEFCHIQVSPI